MGENSSIPQLILCRKSKKRNFYINRYMKKFTFYADSKYIRWNLTLPITSYKHKKICLIFEKGEKDQQKANEW